MDIDIDLVDIDADTDTQLLKFSQCHLACDLHA